MCSDAVELRKLVTIGHLKLSINRQLALLGLPRSTYYFRLTPTLYNWRLAWRLQGEVVPTSDKEPEGFRATDTFTVVLETARLIATDFSRHCREPGLFLPLGVDEPRGKDCSTTASNHS